ncbi:hypothetical protein SO694_00022218 [Aureococcus anophagefferens]|uniref:Uncharacterized protein n=1 Tax=Aureococcus anophagefferens TaxID=44056 RepID=A0ABR1FT23_AURAN
MAPVAAAAATASSPLDFGVFKSQPTTRVEGDTLKTWDVGATSTERVQLSLQSTGRPAKEALASFEGTLVQGGAIRSYTFGAEVASVAVLLSSAELGERNMKALIELTSGPNQVKQFFEIYCSSGYKNPFYAVIQTPDPATTIRPEMGGGSFSGGLLR